MFSAEICLFTSTITGCKTGGVALQDNKWCNDHLSGTLLVYFVKQSVKQ